MKKLNRFLVIIILSEICSVSYASWWSSVFNSLLRLEGINTNIGNGIKDQNYKLNDIDGLMKQVQGSLTGTSGWGDYNFHDYQSYGSSADNWSAVLQMSEQGRGSGSLGEEIGEIGHQFPMDKEIFNKGVTNSNSQKYYVLKSKTVLAARAASELDYNKIQVQISYQHMLQQQIEKTKDLKAATDLLNRIQVEGNLINLEILRQVALSNQQQAVTEQAGVNAALSNARFLSKQ